MEVGEIPDAARNQESRTCDLGGVERHALALRRVNGTFPELLATLSYIVFERLLRV